MHFSCLGFMPGGSGAGINGISSGDPRHQSQPGKRLEFFLSADPPLISSLSPSTCQLFVACLIRHKNANLEWQTAAQSYSPLLEYSVAEKMSI
ncbi:hypothetical protein FKM82_019929 [Ascaphus truei]